MADFENGSFEAGSLSGWSSLGTVSVRQGNVQLGGSGDSDANFAPTNGSYFTELSSQSESVSSIESFFGLGSGYFSNNFDGEKDNNYTVGSAIKQSINIVAGQKLSFDWKFKATDYTPYNDSAFVIHGPNSVQLASIYSVGSYGATSGSREYEFTTSGTYIVGVAVFNETDSGVDAYLGVDNFRLSTSTANSAPTTSGFAKRINEDSTYTFTESDFSFSDDDSDDSLKSILITSLPTSGRLLYDGSTFSISGSSFSIHKADLSKLSFSPAANTNGDDYTSFQFKVVDQSDAASAAATTTIHVDPVNDAPISGGSLYNLRQAVKAGVSAAGGILGAEAATGPAGALFGKINDADGDSLILEAARGSAENGETTSWHELTENELAINGQYGTLIVRSDGSYRYDINSDNPIINELFEGQSLEDNFALQITDGLSNSITQALTIGINGRDNVAKPAIHVVAGDDRINNAEKTTGVLLTGTAPGSTAVDVNWGDLTKRASVVNGLWSARFETIVSPSGLNGLNSPRSVVSSEIPADNPESVISITAFDSAGNRSQQVSRSVTIDIVKPERPTVAEFADDGQINAAERSSGVTISGTGEALSTISLRWEGVEQSTTVQENGQWRIDLNSTRIPIDKSRSLLVVRSIDASGNQSLSTRRHLNIDTQAPTSVQFNPIGEDGVINAGEKSSGILLSGTAEGGSQLKLVWNGWTYEMRVNASGNWRQWVSADAIPTHGQFSTVVATATDEAGNTSASTTELPIIDVVAPVAPILKPIGTVINGRQVVNKAVMSNGVVISGDIGSTEANASITVEWGRNTFSTSSHSDGSWMIAIDSSLIPRDAETSEVRVIADDTAGNASALSTATLLIDTVSPKMPTLNAIGGDDLITHKEWQTGVVLSGYAEAESTVHVQWGSYSGSAIASSNGVWTLEVSTSQIPITQTTSSVVLHSTDEVGNVSDSTTRQVLVAIQAADVPTLYAVATDNRINSAEALAGVTISGLTEAGSWVNVQLGLALERVKSDQNGAWNTQFRRNVLPQADGSITLNVDTTNSSGVTSESVMRNILLDRSEAELTGLIVEGKQLRLQFSKELAQPSINTGNFSVTAGSTALTILSAVRGSTTNELILTLNQEISASADVMATYKGSASQLIDISGNPFKEFRNAAPDSLLSHRSIMGLAASYKTLTLTGPDSLTGIGNASDNVLIGNDSSNVMIGKGGRDWLTGKGGSDVFRLETLGDSILGSSSQPGHDRITDLAIGIDSIDGPRAVVKEKVLDAGSIGQSLSATAINNTLNARSFQAHGAAVFTVGPVNQNRTFVALNDGIAGFNSRTDGLIEITGYSGLISNLDII